MQTCRISIIYEAPQFELEAVQSAFESVTSRLAAADLAGCHQVSVSAQVGPAQVDFSLMGVPEPPDPVVMPDEPIDESTP